MTDDGRPRYLRSALNRPPETAQAPKRRGRVRPHKPDRGLRGDARNRDRGHVAPAATSAIRGDLGGNLPYAGGAGVAVVAIVRETVPSLLEIMDATTVRAVEALQPMDLDLEAAAYVYARSDAGGHQAVADVERMSDLCERAGASLVVTTDEEAEGRLVMAARRLAYPALERLGATILDDVCVPLGCVPQLLEGVASIARRRSVIIATFGHAGDGNMHPTIVYDLADRDALRSARAAFDDIVRLALALRGTVTGEHGVGMLKQPLLGEELGASAALHRAVKGALDPHGTLNPGRAI